MSQPARAPHAIPVSEIVSLLTAQIRPLVAELLPNGKQHGREWQVGGIDGQPGTSMMVNLSGRAGVWSDFATGEGGDVIDLIAAVLFAKDKGHAIRWARSWLGLDGLDPSRLAVTRRAAAVAKKPEDEQSEQERRDSAARMWRGAKSFTDAWGGFAKTPAADYLHGRGISFARSLAAAQTGHQLGRVPGVLAFSRECWNGEVRGKLPAMLAAVQVRNQIVGVHRTYLEITGPNAATKAKLQNAKLSLGPIRGGVIPLWRGDSGLSWSQLWDAELDIDWPKAEADRAVTLTEGIEDALSIAVASPGRRVVACVSLANMGSAVLPPCLKDVTIAADNDPRDGKAAMIGLPRVIKARQRQGRTVRVARAPEGHKDFNAWLQALQTPAAEAVA
jgi:hypothetical protein